MKIKRKIPAVMFSQHPDHANIPFWHNHPHIKTQDEIKECYLMFKELVGDEVMWDWEGKFADEAVFEKLMMEYFDFFKEKPIGREFFLTFRVPNPNLESGYRLGRAFMVILSAQHLAETSQLHTPPLFEIILPMAESAGEMIKLQQYFAKISKLSRKFFGSNKKSVKKIEIIPIFEQVKTLLNSGKILREYFSIAKKKLGYVPLYFRPFCARSDPALNSGIVPTTLAIKWALSEYAKFSLETKIPTYPIIAPGALPFRGGLTPQTVKQFIKEFRGIRTLVVQSAFRYDFPVADVKKGVKMIQKEIGKHETEVLADDVGPKILTVIPLFEIPYKKTVEKMAPLIQKVAKYIPKRRERVQHVGLFGYSRKVGEVSLPRAIGFTAACYSLGIPPELIGTGRGLKAVKEAGKLKLVEKLYKNLKHSLIWAGRYLRRQSLKELGIAELNEDVKFIEKYLGKKLGPKAAAEKKHEKLAGIIVFKINKGQDPTEEIIEAAKIRRSLG